MRMFLRAVLFVATFLPCAPPFAGACGDKLLVLGRGVKFGSINSSYHASIIAYVPDSVAQSAAVNDPHFQVALQKAGHKLLLVHQADVLAEASKSGKYDIILVDPQDEAMVDKQVTTAAVNMVVMPVVYDGADLKTAVATQFRCIRKTSGKNNACFSTIDKAIESRLKRDELLRRASK
jgi:hypothetical protein